MSNAVVELAELAPSVELVRALVESDQSAWDVEQQLAAVAGWERVLSWATACQAQLLVDIDTAVDVAQYGWQAADAARSVADQVGLALRVSGPSAQRRITLAATVIEKMPAVHQALQVGAITTHHARLAAAGAAALEAGLAQRASAAALTDGRWRTPAQFAEAVARWVHELDPEGAQERHGAATRERRVSRRSEPDGMSSLWALLPAEDGEAVFGRVDACARSSLATNRPGDDRTLEQRRADALVQLVCGQIPNGYRGFPGRDTPDSTGGGSRSDDGRGAGNDGLCGGDHGGGDGGSGGGAHGGGGGAHGGSGGGGGGGDHGGGDHGGGAHGGSAGRGSAVVPACEPTVQSRRPNVTITVAWSTLIGLDDAPADLTGYGPIDAATARRIAADPTATWHRLIVDPVSGRLLDYGRTVYRPPQDLRDFVVARDRTCCFPGCDRPARTCDLDHRHDWQDGGTTCKQCVNAVCRRHHSLKHQGGWAHFRDPDTDDSYWFDPQGGMHHRPATVLPTPAPVEPPPTTLRSDPRRPSAPEPQRPPDAPPVAVELDDTPPF